MRRLFILIISVLAILPGCSSNKDKLINELKSEREDRYSVLAFKSEEVSEEKFQAEINQTFNDPEIWENKLYAFEVFVTIPTEPYNYKKLLEIEELPQYIVLDTEEIVFRSNDIEELESFLLGDEYSAHDHH
ncbi:hypothetical protein SAMN05192559_102376 [Halobacillus karajensis]|uniref:Uncharacterized protein n=1 Tax=Halobacillus karajensis TaxID=195088 RepID=A0A024P6H9_9BACI|nr:hypothetical protein [Halobacillus karajensis]CDQ17830.1 hypothetical protein BN982_00068 [Halobacillus karajensis]CDQ24236.1 hypothetical protein BN983_02508 [Halobacillus karajensis]CDQ29515.1 hypothetical protein BN981_03898 [Halobacillus karajensis]SEH63070.1 hypothetical protein SAMN05192559_102376 [Halobacillus karajensis]